MRGLSNVRIDPSPSVWQAPPPDFALAETTATVRIAADFRPAVLTLRRPFRVVTAGALIVGSEVLRRFRDPLPDGLRLEPVAMSRLLESGPHAAAGLYAAAPPAGRESLPYSEPFFYRTWGKMSGLPPADVEVVSYLGSKERVEPGPALWALVTELLEHHGFTLKDLSIFATSPNVATALAAAALDVVRGRHALLSARELAPLQAQLLDKLPGWDKAAYASPVARDLWAEAILDGVARAPMAKLPALVKLLAPAPAEPAGGAQ